MRKPAKGGRTSVTAGGASMAGLSRLRASWTARQADIFQQPLQVGTVGGSTGVPPIVIAGPDQGPAGMGLTLDVGGGSIVLSIQRVELLVEPVLGRDPRIDRAADRLDRSSPHGRAPVVDLSSLFRRPKNRGPFHLVPVIAKATLERLS